MSSDQTTKQYTSARRVVHQGVVYLRGDVIPSELLEGVAKRPVLIKMERIIVTEVPTLPRASVPPSSSSTKMTSIEVMDYVGDDLMVARQMLDVEERADKPRKVLIRKLQYLIGDDE